MSSPESTEKNPEPERKPANLKYDREQIYCPRSLAVLKLIDALMLRDTPPPSRQYFNVVFLNTKDCSKNGCDDCTKTLGIFGRPLRGNLNCPNAIHTRAQLSAMLSGNLNMYPIRLSMVIATSMEDGKHGCVYCKNLMKPYEYICGYRPRVSISIDYDLWEDELRPIQPTERETVINPKDELL